MRTRKVENTVRVVLALAATLALSAVLAWAEPTSPLNLAELSDETRDLASLEPQTINAQAGNVTELNIEGISITTYWQGFFGNITGTITLDDANNNTLYNWTDTSPDGEVYAARSSTVDFSTVGCATDQNVSNEGNAIDQSGSESDSIQNTFATNSHPSFVVGTTAIGANACNSTNTYVSDGDQTVDFYEVLLSDGNDVFVYATIIDQDTLGFDDGLHDFQLLVGENGTDPTSTPYYFFVELN